MQLHLNLVYGSISGFIINERQAIITFLSVEPNYRNKGIGTKLLKWFMLQVSHFGVIHVELDDCTDNYRKPHNIYLKYGFEYYNNNNRMHANVRNTLKKLLA